MKEKIKMHYAPGRGVQVHKLNTVSDEHLEAFRLKLVYAIKQEQENRRIMKRYPKKRSKLRRFFRRLWLTYLHRIDVMCDAIVGTPSAAEIEYIGLEDGKC
jgi:hypothetical protein